VHFDNLTNKPTTIAGYGITNAFSGSYIDLTDKPLNATSSTNGFMSNTDKTKLDTLQNANIIAGTGISISGTYPNITISNILPNGSHYLGEEYLGGIIFYLYNDNTGTQRGLIISKIEITATWNGTTVVGANRTEDGLFNTSLMPLGVGSARSWIETLGADWYLPSIDELSILWQNRYHVNKTARAIGSDLLSSSAYYWSSTEYNATYAFGYMFNGGYSFDGFKSNAYNVRAVRAF